MEATETERWIPRAEVAGMIRKDLKRAFPGVKFSVRSQTYSMGGSITISWTDGPTERRVNEVIGVYQDRGFDGSIDMEYRIRHYIRQDGSIGQYRSSGTQGSLGYVPAFSDPLPAGAKPVSLNTGYLSTSRHHSDEFKARFRHLVPATAWDVEQNLWRILQDQNG